MADKGTLKYPVKNQTLERFVSSFGGVKMVSEALDISMSSVSMWLRNRIRIPVKHAINIEILSKGEFKASDFRPDVMKRHVLTKEGASIGN
jgi:DNA-binding transcriptional regulator YdaS (Cro superfamily)